MRTTITLLAAAAALASTAAVAQPDEHRFVHEGSTYVYTSAAGDKGQTVISGRRLPSGDTFHLVVDGQHVSGTSGGARVSFRTATARGAAGGIVVAAN